MKNIILLLLLTITLSCTENWNARVGVEDMTIELPKGVRLVEVTWKDADLWYLTEPMDADYTPKTKTFKEKSEYGIYEGAVIFVESR